MDFKHLTLQITDTCPLQCAYCCVESGPGRTTSMALEDAISYVRQAKDMNPDVFLSFTGGEPFSSWKLQRDIARFAHSLGIWHTTITSAVWCKSRAFARTKLAELQNYGLRTVSISYDSFHEPWVTPEKVRNCVSAATELGIDVAVAGSIVKGSKGARDLLPELANEFPSITIGDGWVQPTGRGSFIPVESLYTQDWGDKNLGCPVTSDLLIQTDGSVYPCCSTGGDYSYLDLGNAREIPLAEIRTRLERSLWFRLITRRGFLALEGIVRRYHPDVTFPRQHAGVCNLCALVFGHDELGTSVRDALERYEVDRADAARRFWEGVKGAIVPRYSPETVPTAVGAAP